jgi:hypothetical protein
MPLLSQNLPATAFVTLARYDSRQATGAYIVRHNTSTRGTFGRRGTSMQTHHIHYDPVSGYIHKFRLDGSQDSESLDKSAENQPDLPLIVATSVAVGLLLLIGWLTL